MHWSTKLSLKCKLNDCCCAKMSTWRHFYYRFLDFYFFSLYPLWAFISKPKITLEIYYVHKCIYHGNNITLNHRAWSKAFRLNWIDKKSKHINNNNSNCTARQTLSATENELLACANNLTYFVGELKFHIGILLWTAFHNTVRAVTN